MQKQWTKAGLQEYVSNYQGSAKIRRLLIAAEYAPSANIHALNLAIDESKRGINAVIYQEIINKLSNSGSRIAVDFDWVNQTEFQANSKINNLKTTISNHKSSLEKQKIRSASINLASYQYDMGKYNDALKTLHSIRDYSSGDEEKLELYFFIIKVSVELRNSRHVENYVSKIEKEIKLTPSNLPIMSQVWALYGLSHLAQRKYKSAANAFTKCNLSTDYSLNDVLTQRDIAIYGVLCGLASYSRDEVKAKLLENPSFVPFLELEPTLKTVLENFIRGEYGYSLSTLVEFKALYLAIDPHVVEVSDYLVSMVRSKALIQHIYPYMSVDLSKSAAIFETTVADLEKEIVELIMKKEIEARIDSQKKVLHCCNVNYRTTAFQSILGSGVKYMDEVKALLLRVSLLKANFAVKGSSDNTNDYHSNVNNDFTESGMEDILSLNIA